VSEDITEAIKEIEDLGYAVVNDLEETSAEVVDNMAKSSEDTKPDNKDTSERDERYRLFESGQCPACLEDLKVTPNPPFMITWCDACKHIMSDDVVCYDCGGALPKLEEGQERPKEIDCSTCTPIVPPAEHFLLKVSLGREWRVIEDMRARMSDSGASQDVNEHIFSLTSPEGLEGYILIEADEKHWIDKLIGNGIHGRHIGRIRGCGRIIGTISEEEVKELLKPKNVFDKLQEGYLVEINHGAFRGERARIQSINENKETVTVELFDSVIPMPITLDPKHIRVIDDGR
jgi:transcriptional antiterminator NusG